MGAIVAGGIFSIGKKFFKKKASEEDVITTAFKQFFEDLPKVPPETLEILTYDDVIKYSAQQASLPELKDSRKGVVFRQADSQGGYRVGQAFLDGDNQAVFNSSGKPYGRQLLVRRLDEELLEIFGNKDYFLVT